MKYSRALVAIALMMSASLMKGMSCRIVIIDNKVTEIQNTLDNIVIPKLCSILDGVSVDLSTVLDAISASDVLLCSKIDNISFADVNLDAVLEAISESDALTATLVGTLDETGTCLPTLIDVPEDIDNLEISSIRLLKTILLELRGCFDYS